MCYDVISAKPLSAAILGQPFLCRFRRKSGRRARAAIFLRAPGLTQYVGRFVASTKYEDIPEDVIELGKEVHP